MEVHTHLTGITRKASLAQLAEDCVEQERYAAFTTSVPRTISISCSSTLQAAQTALLEKSSGARSWILKRSEVNRGRDLHVLSSSDDAKLVELCSEQGPWVCSLQQVTRCLSFL